MPIRLQCSQCHQNMTAKDSLGGKRVKCPKCGAPIDIPHASPSPDAEALSPLDDPFSGDLPPAASTPTGFDAPLGVDAPNTGDPLGLAETGALSGTGAPTENDPLSANGAMLAAAPIPTANSMPSGPADEAPGPFQLFGIKLTRRRLFVWLPLAGVIIGALLALTLGALGRPSYAKALAGELTVYLVVGVILGGALGFGVYAALSGTLAKREPPEEREAGDRAESRQNAGMGGILGGIVLIIAGLIAFFVFNSLESKGGSIRTHWLVIALYKMFGKWGLLGILGGIGIIVIVIGVVRLLARDGDEQ